MIRGFFDGASRGNPGPAGAGAVIYDGSQVIWRCARPLGIKTNNEAEYMAIGILVDELIRRGIKKPEICGDSKLVISQVTGAWKIREARLAALAAPVKDKINDLGAKCRWVPREQNAEADRLSNLALDKGEIVEDLEKTSEVDVKPDDAESTTLQADPAKSMRFKRAWGKIWLVADGDEVFAVDLTHGCCSCPQGRLDGRCRHVESLKEKIATLKC